MNLIKFPLITADDFVVNSEIVLDASKLVEAYVTGATMVATFASGSANSILTFTFDDGLFIGFIGFVLILFPL